MNQSGKPRVQWVVSHPIQYQVPLLRRVAREPDMDVEAVFACRFGTQPVFDPGFGRVVDFGIELLGGYVHRFVPSAVKVPDPHRFFGLRARGPIVDCRAETVAVIHGWRTCYMLQAAFQCHRRGLPFIMRAENPVYRTRGEHRTWRSIPRDLLVNWLLRRAAVCLYIGTANRRFLEQRGVPPERLVHMPYYVDNESVRAAASEGRTHRAELRATLGIPGQARVVVCVGKFLVRKRQRNIIQAIARLPENVHALFIGSGDEEAACRTLAASLGVARRCHFAGFLASAEAWRWLGACDVFCLPSSAETWGLVVNEALVAGLPLVVTDEVGCGENLVREGRTGSIYPVDDIVQLSAALGVWTAGTGGLDPASQRELVEGHSIEAAVAGFKKAVAQAAGPRD